MPSPKEEIHMIKQQLDRIAAAYDRNNMKLTCLTQSDSLKAVLTDRIPAGSVVSFGGSMTLEECGALRILREMDKEGRIRLLDRGRPGLSREEIEELFRQSFSADVYLVSANAMTEDGWLYNVDGNGNRVSAMIFGPKKVLVLAGENKLVPDKAAAEERVRRIAAPKNAARLHKETPCVKTERCMACHSADRICCSYVFLGQQRERNRIEILLLEGSYGY